MTAVFKYVPVNPAMSRQRSRSGEVLIRGLPCVAASPAMVRQRSRSGEVPVRSGEVPVTPLKYVPPSQAMCRQRSRSVEVPVEVVSPSRMLPQVALQYIPPKTDNSRVDIFHKPTYTGDSSVVGESSRTKHTCSSPAVEDAGPKIQMNCETQDKVCTGARRRFLDASSRSFPPTDAKLATLASHVNDVSCQEAATWSAEELSAGSVKLRWQAGKFSVVDKQEKNECPEAAPEPHVRYFDGSVEVDAMDLADLKDLLSTDLAVSIGEQPRTGLSGAIVIPGPEFFSIGQGQIAATVDSTPSCRRFCFSALLRHPGFEDSTSTDENDEKTTKVVVAKTKEEEATEKANAAEQKVIVAEAERDAAWKQAVAAEKERDTEKANAQAAKVEVSEAVAKVCAAEQKVLQAERECNADHKRALAAEKERDEEKIKVDAAKIKEAEAIAKANAAQQRAVEADVEREAAHTRAIAAEIERDTEKVKVDAAKIEVAEALAMLFAAQQKIIRAEKERDAIKAWTIAAKKRDEDVSTQAGSPESFDISQGDTPVDLDSPDSRRTFRFPLASSVPQPVSGGQSSECPQSSDDTSDSFSLDAEPINIDKILGSTIATPSKLGEGTVSSEAKALALKPDCSRAACLKAAECQTAKGSVAEFPAHLQVEAAFAHAYLPVDAYVNLVLSEFASTKKTTKGYQQPIG